MAIMKISKSRDIGKKIEINRMLSGFENHLLCKLSSPSKETFYKSYYCGELMGVGNCQCGIVSWWENLVVGIFRCGKLSSGKLSTGKLSVWESVECENDK